jgi:hypothetical protein
MQIERFNQLINQFTGRQLSKIALLYRVKTVLDLREALLAILGLDLSCYKMKCEMIGSHGASAVSMRYTPWIGCVFRVSSVLLASLGAVTFFRERSNDDDLLLWCADVAVKYP